VIAPKKTVYTYPNLGATRIFTFMTSKLRHQLYGDVELNEEESRVSRA